MIIESVTDANLASINLPFQWESIGSAHLWHPLQTPKITHSQHHCPRSYRISRAIASKRTLATQQSVMSLLLYTPAHSATAQAQADEVVRYRWPSVGRLGY